MRLKILDRYIAVAITRATMMTVLVLVILLLVFGLVDEFEDVGEGRYAMSDAVIVALMSTPRYVFEVFPVAALIGSLISLGSMAAHGELIAMRSAGLSLRDIVLTVLKTGMALMIVIFLFGELVAPPSEQYAQELRAEKKAGNTTLRTRYGFWARDSRSFINIRKILPGNRLEDIYIYEFDDQRTLNVATYAGHAEFEDGRWLLYDIKQSRLSESGVVGDELKKAEWHSLLDPSLLSVVIVKPTMLPTWGLYQYMKFMRANGQAAVDYEVAFWLKIATPLATLVMLFLAVPFVMGNQRAAGAGQRIFLGALIGIGFYMFSRAMSYVAVVYDISPILSAAIPTMAFLTIGVVLLKRVR